MNVEEEIRDEVSSIQIGSGYYSQTIGIDGGREVAAVLTPLVRRAQAEAWVEGMKAGLLRADYEYGAIGFQHVRRNPYDQEGS